MTRLSIAVAMLLAAPASFATMAGAAVPAAGAPARPAEMVVATTGATMITAAAALKAGEYHWPTDAASEEPVLIAVSIPDQKLYAWRGGMLFAVSTVSTGKKGHATPTGAFPIMEKHREHYSNKYDNAPMPFMQRLDDYGIAMHAGYNPGEPASHGCIRLPAKFAAKLYQVTGVGTTVLIGA